MTAPATVALAHRAVLAITGEDRHAFLQGLLTNDISKVTSEAAQWSALLTPQGKYLHDFFIVGGLLGEDPALLFDCEAARLDDLKTRLSRYKLRSKAALTPLPDLSVHAVFGPGALDALGLPETAGAARTLEDGSVAFVDPRLPAMGARILGKAPASLPSAMPEDYDRLRYGLGLPDGSRDIEIEKGLMLESGFEELGGVDFSKGCYV
ncbi:MAG: YgfZ/GcvT domain-containing protein, partial [Rhodospirillaceae bacterium]